MLTLFIKEWDNPSALGVIDRVAGRMGFVDTTRKDFYFSIR